MTPVKDFLGLIQSLFENVLFFPLNKLRILQNDSWVLANTINWIFLIVCSVAFIYWLKQLGKFQDEEHQMADKHYGKYRS